MKKAILFAVVLLSVSTAILAQPPRFGANLGISLNQAKYKPDSAIDRRIFGGFDGGLLVEFSLGKKLKLQPELNYTITGVELNNGTTEKAIKLQYLTIPLLVKVNVVNGFNLFAGPQHGILLSAWEDHSGAPSRSVKEYFKFSDLVIVAGGEYKFKNGLFLGARYNHSIEQIGEEEMGFEMMNRYLSARVGYIF